MWSADKLWSFHQRQLFFLSTVPPSIARRIWKPKGIFLFTRSPLRILVGVTRSLTHSLLRVQMLQLYLQHQIYSSIYNAQKKNARTKTMVVDKRMWYLHRLLPMTVTSLHAIICINLQVLMLPHDHLVWLSTREVTSRMCLRCQLRQRMTVWRKPWGKEYLASLFSTMTCWRCYCRD